MKMKITLHGVAYEVEVEILEEEEGFGVRSGIAPIPHFIQSQPVPTSQGNDNHLPPPAKVKPATTPAGGKTIIAPVGGTIIEVKLKAGDKVHLGDEILVLEAMKMHTSIKAPGEAVIKSINVSAGDIVRESQVLVEFE